jgi:tRNA nucleotidyltransferase/poly(A) polymerase
MLLGREPKDYDIVTDIPYQKLIDIFTEEGGWDVKETGQNFLVITIAKNNEQFEIANFRKDGVYLDGRRPESVEIGDMIDDAYRRDFTINAIYYNPFTDVYTDPTRQGVDDLKGHIIRFIGKPKDRINEDKLRIMRAYRFASQLDFYIEVRSLKACRRAFDEMIKEIATERIKNEIEKMARI